MMLDGFIGNKRICSQLVSLLETGRFPHAVIIEGEEGLGKKTLAKEIALSLFCTNTEEKPCRECAQCNKIIKGIHPDFCEYFPDDSKKSRPFTVDTVREIINDAAVSPNEAQYKICVLNECERMNPSAQNALLKLIEEPPEYAVFLLLATNKTVFLETVLSRSVVISLEGVDYSEGAEYICKSDSSLNPEDVKRAIALCNGNIGKTLEMLREGKLKRIIDIANDVALATISNNEYELIKACAVFERDNQTLISVLTFLKSIFRDALLFESNAGILSNQTDSAKKLSSVLTKGKLIKMIRVCDDIISLANGNGNNALLITKLCYELRRAQGR